MMEYCPTSGKIKLASAAQAWRALKRLRRRKNRHGPLARGGDVYRCPDCGLWHTTSMRTARRMQEDAT